MKQPILKADGTPTKSKAHAITFLKQNGIPESCLIEENGQFFYEGANDEVNQGVNVEESETPAEPVKDNEGANDEVKKKALSWDTPVYLNDGCTNTKLKLKPSDVDIRLKAKHPAGQSLKRPYSALEIKINNETFIISLELSKKLFEIEE